MVSPLGELNRACRLPTSADGVSHPRELSTAIHWLAGISGLPTAGRGPLVGGRREPQAFDLRPIGSVP
jgi:hypothetical protein